MCPALEAPSLHHGTARAAPGFVDVLNEFLVPRVGNMDAKGTEACSCDMRLLVSLLLALLFAFT